MKKTLIVLLILMVLASVFAGAVLADADGDARAQRDAEHEAARVEREAAKAEREAAKAEWKANFEANKMTREGLRLATKEQVSEQRAVVNEYKMQLRTLRQEIGELSEEEKAMYKDQIDALRVQIKEAQGYTLQIRLEGVSAKTMLSPSCITPAERPVPTVTTVDAVAGEVFDDLGEDDAA